MGEKKNFVVLKSAEEFKGFSFEPTLILVFASDEFKVEPLLEKIKAFYPKARIAGCSAESVVTSEVPFIFEKEVLVIGLELDPNHFEVVEINFKENGKLEEKLKKLKSLYQDQAYILLSALSFEGKDIFYLLKIIDSLSEVAGGIAGAKDFSKEKETFYIFEGQIKRQGVVLIVLDKAYYELKCFCFHGWIPVEKEFQITKVSGMEIFDIDEEPALQVVKRYVKKYIETSLNHITNFLCPMLLIERKVGDFIPPVSIKDIKEDTKSITVFFPLKEEKFYFGVPDPFMFENFSARLEKFLEKEGLKKSDKIKFAFIFSCAGRKAFLEETILVECGKLKKTGLRGAGFFTWGEVGFFSETKKSFLQNLTLTLGILCER